VTHPSPHLGRIRDGYRRGTRNGTDRSENPTSPDGLPVTGRTGIGTLAGMATLRLFAAAREAAGTGRAEVPGTTVDDVLAVAVDRYGATFEQVLATCKVWVNGDEAGRSTPVGDGDEVAVLPPVSGGS
jgi:molybdopterin synthase sulfur carrier subunit